MCVRTPRYGRQFISPLTLVHGRRLQHLQPLRRRRLAHRLLDLGKFGFKFEQLVREDVEARRGWNPTEVDMDLSSMGLFRMARQKMEWAGQRKPFCRKTSRTRTRQTTG